MINNQTVSLVLPCKNESRSLKAVLSRLPKEIDEIIVADNNSNDKTKQVAASLGAKIYNEPRNDKFGIGYGFALQKGIKEAKGDIIVCMDGDGSYPIKEIPQIVKELIKNKLDFISCNRLPFNDPKKMSIVRTTGVRILNMIAWILYGYRIKDSLTGMWVFRKNIFKQLGAKEGGWDFSLEIKLKALTNNEIKFAERRISYHDRLLDLSKQNLFQTGFHHAIYLFKLKYQLNKRISPSIKLELNNKLSEAKN